MAELTSMANIDREMAKKLTSVGIDSPEKLIEAGAKQAFLKLKETYPQVCLVQRVIEDARKIGYSHMLLDTLPFLKSAIHLQKDKLKEEIKAFYLDMRGEEIGMIEQMQLLELFEERLAPVIYNRALDDAKRWFGQMIENLDSDYYTLYKNEQ